MDSVLKRTLRSKSSEASLSLSLFQSPSALRRSEDAPCPEPTEEPVLTGGALEELISTACVRVDRELREQSRMRVEAKKVLPCTFHSNG